MTWSLNQVCTTQIKNQTTSYHVLTYITLKVVNIFINIDTHLLLLLYHNN